MTTRIKGRNVEIRIRDDKTDSMFLDPKIIRIETTKTNEEIKEMIMQKLREDNDS